MGEVLEADRIVRLSIMSMFTASYLEERCKAAGLHMNLLGEVSAEVAGELLGVAEKTLRNWRYQGLGPAWRLQGKVWYALTAIADWLNEQTKAA